MQYSKRKYEWISIFNVKLTWNRLQFLLTLSLSDKNCWPWHIKVWLFICFFYVTGKFITGKALTPWPDIYKRFLCSYLGILALTAQTVYSLQSSTLCFRDLRQNLTLTLLWVCVNIKIFTGIVNDRNTGFTLVHFDAATEMPN